MFALAKLRDSSAFGVGQLGAGIAPYDRTPSTIAPAVLAIAQCVRRLERAKARLNNSWRQRVGLTAANAHLRVPLSQKPTYSFRKATTEPQPVRFRTRFSCTVAPMTKFLELIRPKGGLIVLAAMLPDGGAPKVMTYEMPGEIGEAVAWMNEMAALGHNIYYQHQHVADRHLSKLRKEDITEIGFLHADIDWKTGGHRIKATPSLIESTVTGLRTSIVTPPPSIIVCSGNGLQALWRLESPVDVQMAERANKKLQYLHLADEGTWNADRLLRMPGYTNRPSAQKRHYGIEDFAGLSHRGERQSLPD